MFSSDIIIFEISLISSTLLCSLCCGITLIFAIVIMPGLATLDDTEYLRAFKAVDGIIQNNQPIFIFTWAGSVVSVLITTFLGLKELRGKRLVAMIFASVIYLIGQVTTATGNIPLNNRLQELDLDNMDENTSATERANFEDTWNRWNVFRTVVFFVASLVLSVLLLLADSRLGDSDIPGKVWRKVAPTKVSNEETMSQYGQLA